MTTKRILSIALFLIVLANVTAFAQRNTSLISSKNYIGIEAGLNYSWLGGGDNFFFTYPYPFSDDPTNPVIGGLGFQNLGGDIGFNIAGTLDLSLTDFFGLQGKVFYRTNNTGTTESITRICPSTTPGGPDGTVDIQSNYKMGLSFVGVDVGARLQFIPESFYGIVGLEFASLTSTSFSGYEHIIGSSNGCDYLFLPSRIPANATGIDIGEGSFTSGYINSTQLALKLGIGTFLHFGDNSWVLTPELQVGVPLSPLFGSKFETWYKDGYPTNNINSPAYAPATTPQLWYASFTIALKFPFGGSSVEEPNEVSVADGPDHNEKFAQLKGRVTDAKTGEPVEAEITVTDLNSSKVVAKSKTDDDGLYDIRVKAPGRYSVTADAGGYLFGSAYFQTDADGRILKGEHDIKLSSANDGRTRLLVFFDFNKDNLQPESFPELERAVTIMKSHPSMEVEIAGYTDNVGSDTYNKDLSTRRANSVKEYLVRHEIAANRVQAKGYGEASPILPNDTDEGRAANRRVEFVVLKK